MTNAYKVIRAIAPDIPCVQRAEAAVPLFNDPSYDTRLSTLGWPTGQAWQYERVQSFADQPPSLTSREDEVWHLGESLPTSIRIRPQRPKPRMAGSFPSFSRCITTSSPINSRSNRLQPRDARHLCL